MTIPDPIKRALLRYVPFAPAILLAALLPIYWVDVPQYDEWDSVMLFEHLSQGTLTAELLFRQVNEYRQFFPNVIFVALGQLTHWDLRYEMILIFIAVSLISLNVRRLAALTAEVNEIQFAVLFFVANLIIFSLTQYENWWQAQQLVYYVPILCVTTCITVNTLRLRTTGKFALCAVLSFISMFSSANGVVCWIVVLPLLVFSEWPKNRRLVIWLSGAWIVATGLCVLLYLDGYHKPWWTPSPATGLHQPWHAFVYFLGFMGGPLGLERAKLSIAAGAIMMMAFTAVGVYLVKHWRDRALNERAFGWLVIGAYSLVTGAMTTVGRVGLATGPSQVPRYLGFSVYFVVALVFLSQIVGEHFMRRDGKVPARHLNPFAWVTVAVLLVYQPFMFALSYRQMDAWRTRLLQAKASILLINQLPDTRLTKIIYPNVQFLVEKANALDRLGLLRPTLVKTKHLNELRGPAGGYYGDLREIVRTPDGFTASGSCLVQVPPPSDSTGVPDAIILAYDPGTNDPIAFAMIHPAKRPASITDGVAKSGTWTIRFTAEQLPKLPVTISAWAFDATSGHVFPLQFTKEISAAP